jgi:hypothetical protein
MTYRQPSIPEAAWMVCHALTLEYRDDCYRYWRENYGDSYIMQIQKAVAKREGK